MIFFFFMTDTYICILLFKCHAEAFSSFTFAQMADSELTHAQEVAAANQAFGIGKSLQQLFVSLFKTLIMSPFVRIRMIHNNTCDINVWVTQALGHNNQLMTQQMREQITVGNKVKDKVGKSPV